jgi:alanine dehydrogenase
VKVPAAPGNRHVGLIYLYSSETLELLAIMADGYLQKMRVAGTTGVGAKYLAREDSRVVGLLGSGGQAETSAWALAAVRPIERIQVFSPSREHRKTFAKKSLPHKALMLFPKKAKRKRSKEQTLSR